jgi:hypothetical protein
VKVCLGGKIDAQSMGEYIKFHAKKQGLTKRKHQYADAFDVGVDESQ